MLKYATLTEKRFNSFFGSRLVSMIYKRSCFLKVHPEIYCALDVERMFKIPADRIVTLRESQYLYLIPVQHCFSASYKIQAEENICVCPACFCGLF